MQLIKEELIAKATEKISNDLEVIKRAAEETHANSTSAESKAEGKYDTRGLEASYLAGAQAEQVKRSEEGLAKLLSMSPVEEPDNVLLGSLVVVTGEEKEFNYLILPTGGGLTIEQDSEQYLIITPDSPLGKQLMGLELGGNIAVPNQKNAYVSEIY